uniref:Specifically androgen-regulated gene protein-like n=1 Tax=Oryzias melastigma TaxID=30732 RepID=A0A3B3D5H8_ORYME
MAKSDTWPGGAAMGSLNAVDSAGSCDSVISGNSSDDSMEHLSPEERACLMFLEETIEAMEMMEDSGLSNDELDFGHKLESNNPPTSDESLSCAAADPGITTNHRTPALDPTPESTPAPAVTSKDVETADLEVQSSPSVSRSASDVAPRTPLNPTHASHKSWDLGNPEVASEVDLSIIPPPLDFMDEPELLPLPEELNEFPPPAEPFPEPDAPPPADLQQPEPKVLTESPSLNSEVDGPSCSPPPAEEDSVPLNPYLEVPEPRAPPAVAPKPKSIPANIPLRSHKPTGSEGTSRTSRDVLMDPQKVRMEALRKLGLLKEEEAPPPAFARGGSLKTRSPQEAPISPISPGNPPLKSALSSHAHSQPQTTPKITRSATFEQCSLGPSANAAGQGDATQSPKELRKMRPRPASMGCGKELSHPIGGDPFHMRHAPNVFQPSRESGKLPRSQGISVLICPRPENAEDRREALKKLGLLRY